MPSNIYLTQGALPSEICEDLIAKFNSDSRVQQDPQPDYSTRLFLYLSDKPEWLDLLGQVEGISNRIMMDYFTYPEPYEKYSRRDWFDDGYVLAHYRPGDICDLHDDGQVAGGAVRLATLLFYLNDAEGGETDFPLQNVKIKPRQGQVAVFPPTIQYPHQVLPAKTDRFILQTWITDPELIVSHRSEWEES